MKSLVFDSSSIISLSMNDLLWIIKPLKEKYKGDFLISNAVCEELVDIPLKTKKYKYEALTILNLLNTNYLKIYSDNLVEEKIRFLEIVNQLYIADGENIKIMHTGEIASLAVAIVLNSDAYVVDERTTRLLIEDPYNLAEILKKKLHTKIKINTSNLNILKQELKNLQVIRSTELALMAYENGLFKDYLKPTQYSRDIKKDLIDALLWGLKLRGCSISQDEITEALKIY